MNDPRYPIGRYERRDVLTPQERAAMIEQIAAAPRKMRDAVAGLTPRQLNSKCRAVAFFAGH